MTTLTERIRNASGEDRELKIAMDKELLTSDQRPSREAAEAVGKATKARLEQLTAAKTIQWLTDRLNNCIRLASLTRPEDRAGWVDDAAHFAAALNLLALRIAEENRMLREAENDGFMRGLEKADAILVEVNQHSGSPSWEGAIRLASEAIQDAQINARAALGDTPAGLNRQGPLSDAG